MHEKYVHFIMLGVVIAVGVVITIKVLQPDSNTTPFAHVMPGMPGMPGMGSGMPISFMAPISMETSATGVFLVIDGALIKYSLDGLKRISKLDLNSTIKSVWKDSDLTYGPQNMWIATAHNNNEYVIIHLLDISKVLIVDAQTMKVCGIVALTSGSQVEPSTVDSRNGVIGKKISPPRSGGPYAYSLRGDMLYITQFPYVFQVNYVTGKIISKINLNNEAKKP